MAENTSIEWCDHTFNPWIGCTRVSVAAAGGGGCDNCYAAVSTPARAMGIAWGAGVPRHRTAAPTWRQPLTWNARHADFFARYGRRQRVFCASLADVFDNEVPDQWRHDLFDLILKTPNLDWLLLTKRIGNVMKLVDVSAFDACPNIWLGATVVNQEEADRDIPKLLATPARVRFLSMEPLLGPVTLREEWLLGAFDHCAEEDADPDIDGCRGCPGHGRECHAVRGPRLHWVIAGGESGHGARPMHPAWSRSLREQCAAAGVPFLFKQWGEWSPGYAEHGNDLGYDAIVCAKQHEWAEGHCSFRVGKKAAGRLLDGVTHDGFPENSHA